MPGTRKLGKTFLSLRWAYQWMLLLCLYVRAFRSVKLSLNICALQVRGSVDFRHLCRLSVIF